MTALLERAPPRYAKLASVDKSSPTETDEALEDAMTTMRQGLASMVYGGSAHLDVRQAESV